MVILSLIQCSSVRLCTVDTPSSFHLVTAHVKPITQLKNSILLNIKNRIFVASVSDELQILQQPAVLQHAKILQIKNNTL